MTLSELKEYRSIVAEALLENESPVPDRKRLTELITRKDEIEHFIKGIPKAQARVALEIYCGLYPPFQNTAATWRDVARILGNGFSFDALKIYVYRAVEEQNKIRYWETR